MCVNWAPPPLSFYKRLRLHCSSSPFFFCSWSFTLGVWTFNLHQPPVERSTSHTVFKWWRMTHTSVCLAIFHWSKSGKFDGFVVIFAESPLSLQMGLLQTPNFLVTPLSTEDIFIWPSHFIERGLGQILWHLVHTTMKKPDLCHFFFFLQCERSLGDLVYQIWTFTFKMTVLSSSDRVFPFEVPGATGLDPVTA